MFTIRFHSHTDDTARIGYECAKYEIQVRGVSNEGHELEVKMYRSWADDNPFFEYIGPETPYAQAYVMNSDGKTVDKIR